MGDRNNLLIRAHAVYQKWADELGEWPMLWGPAHIVWEDENYDLESIQWCLDNWSRDHWSYKKWDADALDRVKESLIELKSYLEETGVTDERNEEQEA